MSRVVYLMMSAVLREYLESLGLGFVCLYTNDRSLLPVRPPNYSVNVSGSASQHTTWSYNLIRVFRFARTSSPPLPLPVGSWRLSAPSLREHIYSTRGFMEKGKGCWCLLLGLGELGR